MATINLDNRQFIDIQDKQKYRSLPEIANPAIWLLDLYLARDMNVFEWGCGGSTIFFAQRVAHVTSIEHDKFWAETVTMALKYRDLQNSCINLIEPGVRAVSELATATEYESQAGVILGASFKPYVLAIDAYEDSSFDVVFVDGRARLGCIRHTIPKLKQGGLLVLDNSNRVRYKPGVDLLNSQGWQRLDFIDSVPYKPPPIKVQTSVWYKQE